MKEKTNALNYPRISHVHKALPQHKRNTAEILPFVRLWLEGQDERFIRKVVKVFEGAGVDKRYGIMSIEEVFQATSFQDKNKLYEAAAKELGERCFKGVLKDSGWSEKSIDMVITVSCTGIMIPSLDAYLINALELRRDVKRLPVTEMGCAAGVSGIIYATHYLKANPGKRVALVAVESPTATFQHGDYSMANMVSAALFGDGAACVLMSSKAEDQGPEIKGEGMYHFYEATHLMGFDLTNTGLQMILDPEVPSMIESHFMDLLLPFLKENDSDINQLKHLVFHPGGRKIVQTVEALFGDLGKNIDDTREVLRQYGNMSSVTVLYVLERFLKRELPAGDQGLLLSFGPGFSAQRVLIEWK